MVVEVVGGVEAKLSLDISQFTSAIGEATKEAEKLSSGLANIKPTNNVGSSFNELKGLLEGLDKTVKELANSFKDMAAPLPKVKSETSSIITEFDKLNSEVSMNVTKMGEMTTVMANAKREASSMSQTAMAKSGAGLSLTSFEKELVALNNLSKGLQEYGSEVSSIVVKNENLSRSTVNLEEVYAKLRGETQLTAKEMRELSNVMVESISMPLAGLDKMWSNLLRSGIGEEYGMEIDKIIAKNEELAASTEAIPRLRMPTSESFVKQIQQYATSLKEGGITAQEFAGKLKELGITSKELASISREVGGAYIESFKRGEMGVSELLMKFKELTFTESELYVYNQRLAVSFVQAFRNGAISLEELVNSFKQLDMSEKQTEELTKILEKTITMAFKNGKLEAENYIKSLQEVGIATEKAAAKTKELGSSGSLFGAGSLSNSKNKGTGAGFGGVIDRTVNLVKMMAMLEAFMGVWEATESYMESSSAIRGFYDLLSKRNDATRWNSKNLAEYNQRLSDLQGTYSKLNVRETGAEVMKIGQMYGLTAKEMYSNTKDLKKGQKDFVETALIFTDAMANEGRSARDSSLALKDLIDQGAGWSRRTQEVGITEDVLKAQKDKNGKAYWSGDKQDKEGLIKALGSAETQLHLDERAKQINTVEDGVQALYNSLGALLGGLLDLASPSLIQIFKQLSGIFFELNGYLVQASGWFNSLKDTSPWLYNVGVWAGELAIALGVGGLALRRFGGGITGLTSKLGGLFKKIPSGGLLGGIFNGTKGESTGGTGGVVSETGGATRTLKSTLGNIKNNLLVEAEVFVSLVAGITMALATLWIASEELAIVGQRYEQIRTNVNKGMTALRDYEKLIEDIYPMLIGFMATAGILGAVTMSTDGVGLVAIGVGLLALIGFITGTVASLQIVGDRLAELGDHISGQKANFDKGCKALKEIAEMMGVLAVAVGEMAKADWNALSDNIASALAKLTGGDALDDVLKLADKFNGNDSNSFISQFNAKTKNIGKLNTESAKKFSEVVKSVGQIFKGINELNKALKEEPQNPSQLLDQRGSHLGEIISGINKFNWRFQQEIGKLTTQIDIGKANNLIHSANAIKNINTAIRNLVKDMKADENIVDTANFRASITNLGTQVGIVSGFLARMGKYNADAFSYNNFQSIVTSINNIKNISDSMQGLMGSFTSESIFGNLKRIALGGTTDLKGSMDKLAQQVSQVKTFVSQVNAYGIGNINVNLAPINTAINQVRAISNSMNNLTNTLTTSFDYTTLAYNLWTMGNAIVQVKKFMDRVNASGVGNTNKQNAVAGINGLVTQLKKTLDEFASEVASAKQQLHTDGQTLGNSFKRGLSSTKAGTISTAKSIMTSAVATIRYYAQRFYQTGQYNGKRLDAGFKSGVSKLGSTLKNKLDSIIKTIRGYSSQFYNAGDLLGGKFRDGFLAGLGTIDVNGHINGTEGSYGGEYRKIQSFNLQSAMLKQANNKQTPNVKQTVIKSEKTTTQTEKTVEKDKSKEQAPVINISFEGAIINGSNEFRESIQQIAEEVMLNYLSPNPATGY